MDLLNFWDSSQYEYPTTAALAEVAGLAALDAGFVGAAGASAISSAGIGAASGVQRLSSPPAPTYEAPPATSWLGFGTLPDAIRSVTSAATTLGQISLAKDRFIAERDIARANLESNTNIARYNALSRSYYAQADAAKARNEVAYVTGQATRPAGLNGILLLGVIAAAAWAASQP